MLCYMGRIAIRHFFLWKVQKLHDLLYETVGDGTFCYRGRLAMRHFPIVKFSDGWKFDAAHISMLP